MTARPNVGAIIVLAGTQQPSGELVGPVCTAHQRIFLSDCHGLCRASGSKHDQSAAALHERAGHHELSAVIEFGQVIGMELRDFARQRSFRNRIEENQVVGWPEVASAATRGGGHIRHLAVS